MARDARTRSASLVSVIVKTAKTDNFTLGYVENFHLSETLATELIPAVGHQKARENVLHGVSRADISWGQTHTVPADSFQELGIAPTEAELPTFNPITVTFFDQDRGETICEVQDVLPGSIGISGGAMASLKDNFSGTGIFVKWASEFLS